MELVTVAKKRIQMNRDDDWDLLLSQVSSFCEKNCITVPKMEDNFITHRSKRKAHSMTNLRYYRAVLYYRCVDTQREELKNHFNEVNTELLLCVACLNTCDDFSAFDNEKLVRLAEFYPRDFSSKDIVKLEHQLENYFVDVCSDQEFLDLMESVTSQKKWLRQRRTMLIL